MIHSHNFSNRVIEIYRNAVSIERHKRYTWNICHKSVYSDYIGDSHYSFSGIRLCNFVYIRLVYLIGEHKLRVIVADSLRKASMIFHDLIRIIAPVKAQIHRAQIPFTYAPCSRRKRMNHTGLIQLVKCYIINPIHTVDMC